MADAPNPERTAIVAWLRSEGELARRTSHSETNESSRMYRIGQHDALLLASDAIEAGDHLKDKP